MFWKSILVSAILATRAITEAQQVVTVTKTVYESNQCLEEYAKKILPNNPAGLTTGIPVVLVYEPKSQNGQTQLQGQNQQQQQQDQDQDQQHNTNQVQGQAQSQGEQSRTVASTARAQSSTARKSQNVVVTRSQTTTTIAETTVCERNGCEVRTYTTVIAVPLTYTSALPAVETDKIVFETTSVRTAETTTSTIFSATTLPSTTYTPSTDVTVLSPSIQNPVSSQSVVSSSQSVSIDTSSITGPVTIGAESTAVRTTNSTDTNSSNGSAVTTTSILSSLIETTDSEGSTITSTLYSTSTGVTSNAAVSSSSSPASSLSSSSSSSGLSSGYSNSTSEYGSSSTAAESESTSGSLTDISSELESTTESESATESESSTPSAESSTEASSSAETSEEPSIETRVCYSGDLFSAVDTVAPPPVFPRDQIPISVATGVNNNGQPIGTNKFYTNLVINNQDLMVYPLPYALYWSKSNYYGFGVQHINLDQRVFGSQNTNNVGVASYYFDPANNGEIIFSATSFAEDAMNMQVTEMTDMSALVTLMSSAEDEINYLNIPLVQGMGFATGIYNGNLTPLLNSLYGFQTLTVETSDALLPNVIKYRATLLNGIEWLIYVTLPTADTEFELEVSSIHAIEGSASVDGLIIQVAIAPEDSDQDAYYDAAAGTYVTTATLLGSVVCDTAASYKISYLTRGTSSSGKPLIFALPHHLSALTGDVLSAATGIQVASTTKGNMTGFLTDELSFSETINYDVEFLPWLPSLSGPLTYTQDQLTLLASSANHELAVDIRSTVANMNSNYFSGKVIDKYAQILLVVSEIIQDEEVTQDALDAMKDAFDTFLNNEQYYPLMYDTKFGGVTSTSAQKGDTGADFGAAYYNDHDFHYGYFIHAAAVVGYVDKKLNGTWAEDNKHWVNSLVRDTSNPSTDDTYFPVSRMFDWYSGHSWATGLFNTYKNIESSSESLHHAAALKLWGKVIGDHSLEARGGLMLAIMVRSYNDYFYYKSDNTVEPEEILPNKVSGIFFENKVDYTTFFGAPDEYPQYVHGIHMLPITPSTALARIPSYVQEEWDDQVVTFIDNVTDGWLGILRLNQALIDARSSYEFFASDDWTDNYLDNGQSRTWSLAFSGIYNSL
ncbi:Endo-1,3(4)-beta-glucanase 1 [Candida viswanathii]|uniref:glucan endo-1,3-beta-D-glucosidase n=1 Tax=Candida viswanathii TaxID=5486 RepID=A0A367XTH2_9ASCO|nr:Endo-1,3(4)-beta-glucanase 1 [Candida viswanathii]